MDSDPIWAFLVPIATGWRTLWSWRRSKGAPRGEPWWGAVVRTVPPGRSWAGAPQWRALGLYAILAHPFQETQCKTVQKAIRSSSTAVTS